MQGYWNISAGMAFGLTCGKYARDKASHPINFFWTNLQKLLLGSRSATAATRQNNQQQLPYSRLGELIRCCAPNLHMLSVGLRPLACPQTVSETSCICPHDVTEIREDFGVL
jgi:hypothetical protein